jgi:energy-coupling factor transporter ATP-binding protein EcfA2
MISIADLTFRYPGSSCCALRDVNLDIALGEFIVVTGPSGSGKSTLALAIGGYLFRQYDGEATGVVLVNGMDVRRAPIYDVAEVVGLVQQNPEKQFCTLTVQDEVAFGLENRCLPRETIRDRIAWALEIVGAGPLQDRSLATLSGGEKQKIAIAAMMATKPSVLIFDEPTSNLDLSATAEVFKVIEHIREKAKITVIVIEHKLDYLRPFEPRVIEMEDGRVSELANQRLATKGCTESARYGVSSSSRLSASPSPCHPDPLSPCPLVRVKDLHVGYNGQPVLHNISLEIHPGEFVAVMGDNGSGKTTFLQSLLGLLKPGRGRVEVLGHDTRHTPVSELAQRVGFVFQNPDHQLFADSVWEEAIFAPHNFGTLDEATEAQAEALLERCGLGQRQADHPYRLSYGEKRRLNLISVLAYDPKLILLDEVLIGQDAANAAFLMDLLRERVERGSTVVMVNHNPEITQRYTSRVIFFKGGRAVVDAPTGEAFRQLAPLGLSAYLPAHRTFDHSMGESPYETANYVPTR